MSSKSPLKAKRNLFYIALILLIGLFIFRQTIDISQFGTIQWTSQVIKSILLAICMLVLRDLGYVMRLRLLTDKKISFKELVKIILLWEFGSAITPGMLGGKAVAIFLLIQNKVKAAKASSLVLLAIILDEFIFVLLFPILFFIYGKSMLAPHTDCPDWTVLQSKLSFLKNIDYIQEIVFTILTFIFLFVAIAFIGIFVFPRWIKNAFLNLSRIKILHRWQSQIVEFGKELFETNIAYKNKKITFWIQLALYTLMSWAGRYMVGVAIVWGFANAPLDLGLIYAKQYALWLMFYLPSTPGSSGLAEAIYMAFYCPYFEQGMSGVIAFIWRFISYYIYVILGIFLIFWGMRTKKK